MLFVINYSYIINNHVFTSIILTKGLKPTTKLLHSHAVTSELISKLTMDVY